MATPLRNSAPTTGNDGIALPPEAGATSSSTEGERTTVAAKEHNKQQDDFHPGFRLWAIIAGLGVTTLLAALENTVVTVAAPVILSDLKLGKDYIWITNAFFLCRFVFVSCRFSLLFLCHATADKTGYTVLLFSL